VVRDVDDEVCLAVKLDPSADSCAQLGPQGVYVPCGTTPVPVPACRRTTDTLTDFWFGGRGGGAANLVGWATPQAIDYAIAHSVDVITTHAWALVDGVAAWSPGNKSTAVTYYSTNPSTTPGSGRSSEEWVSYLTDPGTTANVVGRNSKAPDAEQTPDGGYFGYGMPTVPMMTATEALRRIDGRAVTILDTASDALATSTRDVSACINAAAAACSWDTVIIAVSYASRDMVATIKDANMVAMVAVDLNGSADPDEIVASGADYIRIDAANTDAYITSFVDTGIPVVARTNSRRYETNRVQELGCVGVLCNDPVWARGDATNRGILSYYGKGTTGGTLDYWSDQGQIVSGMGYTRSDKTGLWVYNASWITDDQTLSTQLQSVLCGGLYPGDAATTTSWSADFQMQIEYTTQPSSVTCRAGLLFGQTADTDMSGNNVDGLYQYAALRSGYIAYMNVGTTNRGRVVLGRFDGATYSVLAGSALNVAYAEGTWLDFTLDVTATQLTFTCTTTSQSVTFADSTYRGGFMSLATWNSTASPGTWQTGFRNLNPTWSAAAVTATSSSDSEVLTGSGEPAALAMPVGIGPNGT
jgi:hypothetical protein